MVAKSNKWDKVLIVASEFPPGPGGIGNHAFSLSKALAKSGLEVFVATDADYVDKADVLAFDGRLPANLHVTRTHRQGCKTYVNRIRNVYNLVKANRIGLVVFSGKFPLWICAILKVFGVRYKSMAVLHGSEVRISGFLPRLLTNYGISSADFLVPVSSFTYSLLPGKLQKKPFVIIENGIDLGEFAQIENDMEHSELTLKGSPVLLTVGNVTPRKGQHRVIRALPTLLAQYPGLHYHMVGLPSFQKEFELLAEQLGVAKSVTFHGRLPSRSDLGKAYSLADCFVILSENQADGDVEGFGIVILEANYFGVPSLGAKGCGIADAVDDGVSGCLADGDDAADILAQLDKILNNKATYKTGAVKWAKDHDWDVVVEKYLNAIDGI